MTRIRGLSAGPSDGRTDSFKKDIHFIIHKYVRVERHCSARSAYMVVNVSPKRAHPPKKAAVKYT